MHGAEEREYKTGDSGLIIREMTSADIEAVSELEKCNFSTPWRREDFEELTENPDKGCVVAEEDGEIVGVTVYHNILGDVDITNVQVRQDHRGRGISKLLMLEAMKAAGSIGGENFTLEVRASNEPAIGLYESLGFKTEGARKNFYEHPREDALIMWLKL